MKITIKSMMRSYIERILRYRIGVICAILIITVFFGLQLRHMKIENTLDLWAPDDHPFIKTTRLIERVFGGRNFTVIGIVPKQGDIYQPAVLTKVRNIQNGIENIPEAIRVNIVSLAARKAKAIAGTAEGMEVHQMMERLPETHEEIERLRADIERNPIYINALVSPGGKAVSIVADFKINKENASYTPIYEAIKKVVDKERDDQVDIYLGGLPIDFRWMEEGMRQMPKYFGVALLIIIAIQYLSFRSLQGMLLPTLTALFSVIWALGIMVLRGYQVDTMNMNTPILIMAVTAGHAIQILKRYYEEYRELQARNEDRLNERQINNAAIVESIVRVGPVMIMAGIIAAVVFISLKLSDIAMTRRFGELAASGILVGLLLELTFIPTLRSFLKPPKPRAIAKEGNASLLDRALVSLSHALIEKKAIIILVVSTVVILVAFLGFAKVRQDNALKQYFDPKTQLRKDANALNAKFAGTNSIIFLVQGKDRDSLKDPKVLRGMLALQKFLETQPYVGKTQSIADFIKRMNRAMHADEPAYDNIPDSRELIAQYLLLYSSSGEPQDFDTYVDNDYQKGALWVFLKTDSTLYAEELYARARHVIEKNFPKDVSVEIGGSLPQVMAINRVVLKEKLNNILQMAVVLFFMSSLALRSFVGGLFVLMPLVAVVLVNLGAMGWLDIPLDVGTAMVASLAVAIGADYELYLMFRLKEELRKGKDILGAMKDSYLSAGKAVILAALSIAGGYSVLLTSDIRFYSRFGTIVIVTMFVSALATIVLLRSMMMVFKPRFIFGNYPEVQRDRPRARASAARGRIEELCVTVSTQDCPADIEHSGVGTNKEKQF